MCERAGPQMSPPPAAWAARKTKGGGARPVRLGAADLFMLLSQFGRCAAECYTDIDGDGMVGVTDLLIVLGNWD